MPWPPNRVLYPEGGYYRLDGEHVKTDVGDGSDTTLFMVPDALIREHSKVIDSALSKVSPGTERRVRLPNINPAHFNWYVEWLFSGRLWIFVQNRVPHNWEGHEVAESEEFERWLLCLRLSSAVKDSDFRDALVDGFIEWISQLDRDYGWEYGVKVAWAVDAYAGSESPMRELAADAAFRNWDTSDFTKLTETRATPLWFCGLVLAKATAARHFGNDRTKHPLPPKEITTTCEYHEHDNHGKICYKKRRPF
ncbi:hypothetical protein BDV95DRAFT_613121 [Massariosphaeria phaeospora]|uniref:BTB domain-containing protein n=1 Tax=Massariosphaeria phaeospora TaxID=100035 RepID=A0A7C8I4M5_9PLEO|nr:hypothetical protein BDV95DRAFT_613121 [Massariosphaeria phaeospora]